jgi:hypothetical protein
MIAGFLLAFQSTMVYIVVDNPKHPLISKWAILITKILIAVYVLIIVMRTAIFFMIFEGIPNITNNANEKDFGVFLAPFI